MLKKANINGFLARLEDLGWGDTVKVAGNHCDTDMAETYDPNSPPELDLITTIRGSVIVAGGEDGGLDAALAKLRQRQTPEIFRGKPGNDAD